jgi:hypothetical protein
MADKLLNLIFLIIFDDDWVGLYVIQYLGLKRIYARRT